ncbi:acid protease [Thozetella sp. PMI_491]|nr:acid protease [Thozetella sp. PMI_491]
MTRLLSLVAGSLLLTSSAAAPVEERSAQVPAAKHVLALERSIVSKPGATLSDRYRRFRQIVGPDATPVGVGTAVAAQNQIEYLISVQAGKGNFSLIIDTGSSDTWFVRDDFQCLTSRRQRTSLRACNFGPTWSGDFPGGKITEQHFNITYGSANGPFLNGQQVALANLGYWNGDGISSGILGLGLPALTEAFTGNSPGQDGLQNVVQYNPVVTTVSKQINNDIFSLGLSRKSTESFLAFGGVPEDVKVGPYTSTPLQKMGRRSGGSDYFYYTINPELFSWNSTQLNQTMSPGPQVIVDSGTTLNLLPYDMARSINSMFTPHAQLNPSQGGWFVPCNAVPPSFGVQLGGQMLWTDPASMILPQVRDPETGYCATGIGAVDSAPYILGDVFMQGLVNVFDLGKMELRFAKRLP